MKKIVLLVSFCCGSAASILGENLKPDRPNIIWLIAEDLSPDLSCYGVKGANTPNIEKMVEGGLCFANAFASASISSASRSGFVTGMYQTSIKGANCHRPLPENMEALPNGVKTLFDLFHDAGYFVDYNGKLDLNFSPIGYGIKDRDWSTKKNDQPFFLVLQSHYTHRMFEKDSINPIDPMTLDIPPCYPEHPIVRKDWADYFEDIQLLDRWIGQQLDILSQKGLLENTIVVFFGDHGRPHVRDKQFLYEGGTRVPLIMKGFGYELKQCDEQKLISLIDLAPTMLNFAGISVPQYMHGIDIFSNEEHEFIVMARDRCGDAMDHIRAIRTKEYHFIKNEMPEIPWMQFSSYKRMNYPVYSLMKVLYEEG